MTRLLPAVAFLCIPAIPAFAADDPCAIEREGLMKAYCDKKAAEAQKAQEKKAMPPVIKFEPGKDNAIEESMKKHGCRGYSPSVDPPPSKPSLSDKKYNLNNYPGSDEKRKERRDAHFRSDLQEWENGNTLRRWENERFEFNGKKYMKSKSSDISGKTCGQLFDMLQAGMDEPSDPAGRS